MSATAQTPARHTVTHEITTESWPQNSGLIWSLLILLAHLPLLLQNCGVLWSRPHYQYFPVIFLCVGWLIWTRREAYPHDVSGPICRFRSNALLGLSLLLLFAAAVVLQSPWLGTVSFVLAVGGLLLLLGERYFIRNVFGIWMLLWLIVRLPFNYDVRLGQWLQRWSTVASSHVLDYLGIVNLVEGVAISTPTQRLFVDDACSGIASVLAVISCSLIIAVWSDRPLLHTAVLALSGIAWAGIMNTVRIVTIAVAGERWDTDLSSGREHEILGLLTFAMTLAMTLSTDGLLRVVMAPIRSIETRRLEDEYDATPVTWSERFWDWAVTLGTPAEMADRAIPVPDPLPTAPAKYLKYCAPVFLLLGMAGVYGHWQTHSWNKTELPAAILALHENSLPARVEDWKRTSFASISTDQREAQHSRRWTYESGELKAVLTHGYAYHRWHELCDCYTATGWSQSGAEVVCTPLTPGTVYVESVFLKEPSINGYLLFCMAYPDGQPLDPPSSLLVDFRERSRGTGAQLHLTQMWMTTSKTLELADQMAARRLFEQLRADLWRQVFPSRTAEHSAEGG